MKTIFENATRHLVCALAALVAGAIALGMAAARRHFPEQGVPLWISPLVGWAAMIMHFAWSSGFWLHLLQRSFRREIA